VRHFKSSVIFFLIPAVALISLPASATVISVDAAGKVDVKEAKDYRRKQDTNEIAQDYSNPENRLEVFKARPITSQNASDFTSSELFIARRVLAVEPAADILIDKNLLLEFEPSALQLDQKPETENEVTALDAKQELIKSVTLQDETKLYGVFIRREAAKYDKIDVALIESVIETESNYKPTAVSPKGAMGLMQLMPATATRYEVVNAFDPAENIRGGTAELARLFDLYDNPSLALAAYNAGENAVNKHEGIPPYNETQNYVVKVLSKVFNKRQEILDMQVEQSGISQQSANDSEETKTNNISKMKVYSFSWSE